MQKIILLFLIIYSGIAYSQVVDTVEVNQRDTLVFESILSWNQRPCQKPEWNTSFEIINPKDSTYYLIYNEKGQLIEEGLYTLTYYIEGKKYSGFLNSKYYSYKNNGKLYKVFYQIDGRYARTEYYKRGKLKETREF
ncbi:hypothetical protein K6119_01900 [Paracrocinitomix mangrovi]|uniref:hypothetical protein n=1 Tax=Paracrocinitomix mangrovi TaxID=2862509 RepID=UPI001C8E1155|nr:hypothetical protein [Paracrocinitomix mangrovi]UKN02271.1 hypothetical protein K6119_01900 [Paracrocinitomix mangrovi]